MTAALPLDFGADSAAADAVSPAADPTDHYLLGAADQYLVGVRRTNFEGSVLGCIHFNSIDCLVGRSIENEWKKTGIDR